MKNGGVMIFKFLVLAFGVFFLQGCAVVKTQIQFSKQDVFENVKITGTLKGNFSKVQEFRSLLESLEYRASEKSK